MTASLLQLVSVGSEDFYIIGNPQLSYFKSVFKRHTRFAIERIKILPEGTRKLDLYERTQNIFTINCSYGDMLDSLYFSITLPEINSYYPYKFRWIRNLGEMIVDEVSIYINEKLLETIDSNIIHVINNTKMNNKNIDIYNEITCNTEKYNNPDKSLNYNFHTETDIYDRSEIINSEYTSIPSIPEANILIKIPLFFVRDKIVKLPLLKLRNSKIIIKVTLKSLTELYTIGHISKLKIGKLNEDYSRLESNSFEEIDYYRYFTRHERDNPTIMDMVKENSFNNLDISLISYVYFCEENEQKHFTNNDVQYPINLNKTYTNIGGLETYNIEIKNKDIIKELICVPIRDDTHLRNTWSNYKNTDEDIDYTDIKLFNNNYLKLSYEQLNKDIIFIEKINSLYKSYLRQLSNFETIVINVVYYDNQNNSGPNTSQYQNNIINETYEGGLFDDKIYKKYINSLQCLEEHFMTPFIYYGKFLLRDDSDDITIINRNDFRLKIINKNYENFDNQSLKYLPKVEIVSNNILIDYTNNIYSDSILEENIYIPKKNLIPENQINDILEHWSLRDNKYIPYIDENNMDYFEHNLIIERMSMLINGTNISNNISREYTQFGEIFNNYTNIFNNGIIRHSFSKDPENYYPKGHLNLKNVRKFEIIFNLKNPQGNDLSKNYKFNIHIYLQCIKLINIKKDNLFII